MRGGEHDFLREQLPQMQEEKKKAEEDLRWNLQRLPVMAHCPLPIAHCPLPIAHCPLAAALPPCEESML